jgi:hypothetical protein
LETRREYLIDSTSELQVGSPVYQLSSLAKPTAGAYRLQAETKTKKPVELEIFLYDQTGQVEIFKQSLEILTTLEIDYQPTAQSTVNELVNPFTRWRRALHGAYQDKLVVTYAFLDLDYLALHASLTTESQAQERYRQLLLKKLKQYESLINEDILTELTAHLSEDDL